MRKIKTFIYFLITFIFFSSPVKVKASSVALTTESFNLLNSGIDFLSYSGSVPYGFLPFVFNSEKTYQSVLEDKMQKQDVFIVDGNANINIRPLNENEYSLLENATVYDDNGDVVSLSDLYFGTVDNGYFTEKFYCKNDGSIVYQDTAKDSPYIDVKFGGSQYSYLQWQNTYDSLADDLDTTTFNYSLDDNINLTNENISLYYMCAYKYRGNIYNLVSVFVPNCYDIGTVVTTSDLTTHFNGSNLYAVGLVGGDPWNLMSWSWGDHTVDNKTYSVQFYLPAYWWNGGAYMCDYSEFISDNSHERYIINYNGWTYDNTIGQLDRVVSYKKVINENDDIDFSKAYPMTVIDGYAGVIDGIVPETNPIFDPTKPITEINYPIIVDIPISITVDDPIPFPEDDPTEEEEEPTVEPLPDVIDPSLITNEIPIISGLENKFPFSIPWDIYKLVKGLSVTRETPAINETIEIPIINYEWEIDLDLSMYDDSAELFRNLFLILFIIGLAVFSYQHFFGS